MCLRCWGETVESRSTRSKAPFFAVFGVTAFGAAKHNSLSNFARDLRTVDPHEPLRPTSKTLGEETAVARVGCNAIVEFASKIPAAYDVAAAACGACDMQPSQVALGEGEVKKTMQRGNSTLRARHTGVKIKRRKRFASCTCCKNRVVKVLEAGMCEGSRSLGHPAGRYSPVRSAPANPAGSRRYGRPRRSRPRLPGNCRNPGQW